ncbi:MAG: DUF423 domain-containing protein [Chitinophagales bacterium]
MNKTFLISGVLLGALGVALGAFGAHSLKSMISEENLRVFHTGVEYLFYHVFALLATGIIAGKISSSLFKWAGNLFIAGIVLFSGSLFCLTLIPELHFVGIITPFGGLCFIAGWILLAVAIFKS